MNIKIIRIYSIVNDILKSIGHAEDSRLRVTNSEIMTAELASALYYGVRLDHG